MLPLISFETGRRSQTQSSVQDHSWSETANGSLVLSEIGTMAERPRPVCLGGRPVCVQRFSGPRSNILVLYLFYIRTSSGQLVCKF
jgi:hypothetical protein